MVDNSKLIVSSLTQNDIYFILNHAQNWGGGVHSMLKIVISVQPFKAKRF